jgi:hypothetical protein
MASTTSTTTTPQPQPPIAVDDELHLVVGVLFVFDPLENDNLFGLPTTFVSYGLFPCSLLMASIGSAPGGGVGGVPSTPGTCELTYAVGTSLGIAQAVIHITIDPA